MNETSPAAEIVPFRPGLGGAVVELIVSIQRDEFGLDIGAEQQPDLSDIPGFYQKGNGNFWVAVAEGRVVGTISLLDIGNGQAALRKMFVHRDFRGAEAGTAKRLLDTLLDWARARAIREIFLGTTEKFLAAHRFYEKNGFSETPRSQLPPAFPIMTVDTRFFRRRIDPVTDSVADVATRLFAAIERGDLEAVHALYAPDVQIWHNVTGRTQTRDENLKLLRYFTGRLSERRYEVLARDFFPGGFVQRHVLHGKLASGELVAAPVCIVIYVANGKIERIHEYLDAAAVRSVFA